jgi:hypothetical protein
MLAPEPLARYSAAVFAQGHMMNLLFFRAGSERQRLVAARLPGVQRDLDALAAWYGAFDGFGQTLGSALNDTYLKANRVTGGVEDYRRTWRLLVAFARQNDGVMWVDGTSSALARPAD